MPSAKRKSKYDWNHIADAKFERERHRAKSIRDRADVALHFGNDEPAYRRLIARAAEIEISAMKSWVASQPPMRQLRHEASHGVGGIFEGRVCPECAVD